MEWNPRMNVKRRKDIIEQNYFSAGINGSGKRNPCLGSVSYRAAACAPSVNHWQQT
jgi:hypothetical protein